MAKMVGSKKEPDRITPQHRTTSIGRSTNTRPKNKAAKRDYKKYRGQGR